MKIKCKKCEEDWIVREYCSGGTKCLLKKDVEHLHKRCLSCGYIEAIPCADAHPAEN